MTKTGSHDVVLSQQIYAEIRRRIVVGQYPQGSTLSEQRIAEEFQTSRIPLREAIPMLAREGLVTVRPRRSSVVPTWTMKSVDDLFDVRLALEVAAAGAAARRAARGHSPTDLASAVERAERVLQSDDDPLHQAEANSQIHIALVAAAGNNLMDDLMSSLSGRLTWLFYLTSSRNLATQSLSLIHI